MYEELFAAVKRENVLRAIQPLESLGCRPAVPVKRMAHRPQDIADINEAGADRAGAWRMSVDDWKADFASVEREQLRVSMALTPAKRLRWLEEARQFAHTARVLPRSADVPSAGSPTSGRQEQSPAKTSADHPAGGRRSA
ncbi:MAG TPA: hypothetical protein VEK11_09360 [Thermoanaerobaculia bacterium]|nr:hypothetical protein [Thermoanaerobaculia bacterium]